MRHEAIEQLHGPLLVYTLWQRRQPLIIIFFFWLKLTTNSSFYIPEFSPSVLPVKNLLGLKPNKQL